MLHQLTLHLPSKVTAADILHTINEAILASPIPTTQEPHDRGAGETVSSTLPFGRIRGVLTAALKKARKIELNE